MAGTVIRLYKDDGNNFIAGEALAQLNTDIIVQSIEQTQAKLSTQIEASKQRIRELNRLKPLLNTQDIAQQTFKQAELALKQTQLSVAQLTSEKAQLQRTLKITPLMRLLTAWLKRDLSMWAR